MNGKKYTKKKVLEETFEDEDNDVEGENYRDKLEKAQNELYKKL